jgi:hypothetical protein
MEVMAAENKSFEKVYIDLPNHWMGPTVEPLWAKPLGNDLYEIRGVPFFAYGINFLDVVLATVNAPSENLTVQKIVTASGHRTIRLIFFVTVNQTRQDEIVQSLEIFGASGERLNEKFVTLDIAPEGKFDLLLKRLKELLTQNVLEFETADARQVGSFDFHE